MKKQFTMIVQFALGWCPAPRRVPQPSKRAEVFARLLAETRIGWPLAWRAWSPRFADGALLSGYDNVPDVELDGIAPSELLTGQIRTAIADIRDDQLVRLSTAPSHAVLEATLLLCEYAPGWVWTPENTPCVWQFRSSLYHGLVYHIEGAVELCHQLDCLLAGDESAVLLHGDRRSSVLQPNSGAGGGGTLMSASALFKLTNTHGDRRPC